MKRKAILVKPAEGATHSGTALEPGAGSSLRPAGGAHGDEGKPSDSHAVARASPHGLVQDSASNTPLALRKALSANG